MLDTKDLPGGDGPKGGGKGVGGALTKRYGPLPLWGWLTAGGIVLVGGLIIMRGKKGQTIITGSAPPPSNAGGSSGGGSGGGTPPALDVPDLPDLPPLDIPGIAPIVAPGGTSSRLPTFPSASTAASRGTPSASTAAVAAGPGTRTLPVNTYVAPPPPPIQITAPALPGFSGAGSPAPTFAGAPYAQGPIVYNVDTGQPAGNFTYGNGGVISGSQDVYGNVYNQAGQPEAGPGLPYNSGYVYNVETNIPQGQFSYGDDGEINGSYDFNGNFFDTSGEWAD